MREPPAPVLRGVALRSALEAEPRVERDTWLDRHLGIEELPDDEALPAGCVPYLPCGVEEILTLVDLCALGPASHVVDLGAGVGRLAVLVHLLTGARVHGVEIQRALVARARALAQRVAADVTFAHADVRDAALEGDVFVMYAPFTGPILTHTLARLAALDPPPRVVTIDLTLPPTWAPSLEAGRVRLHTLPCTRAQAP